MISQTILESCRKFSDMLPDSFAFLGNSFYGAHETREGELSLEVGTRYGGSALFMLRILEDLYSPQVRPFLLTIDPYGGKPYEGGDIPSRSAKPLYGDVEYVLMKNTLARFPNHIHYQMESVDFLAIAPMLRYWSRSRLERVDRVCFAFLDGDHRQDNIVREIELLLPLMTARGVILVDNADKDPQSPSLLKRYEKGIVVGPPSPPGALQLRIHKDRL